MTRAAEVPFAAAVPAAVAGVVPPDHGRSWWLREALAEEPGRATPPLEGESDTDVLIVGGGFTGLWTAWFLKELQPDVEVVLLEQDICGGGPSGRNGGFVNGWWGGLEGIVQLFGEGPALQLCHELDRSVRGIGDWCREQGVDAWFTLAGDLGVASSPAQEGHWRPELEAARRYGVQDQLVELSPEEIRERCDSPVFGGGMLSVTAATVQPARLVRGLREKVLERGVTIHEDSPVLRFAASGPGGGPVAQTPSGRVRARTAVLAVNAWAEHWRAFHARITVRGSYIVLTAPAPELLREINWTGGEGVWNGRAAVNYLRTTPDGRIAFGTGGMQPDLARAIGPRFAYDQESIATVVEQLWRMFPSFRDVPLDAAWGGPIDVSGSHLPFFGTLPGSSVHHGFGYTGNGVAPSHLAGRILARLALGVRDEIAALPLVGHRPRRFPPEPIRSVGALAVNRAILRKDEAEDAGRRANPLVGLLARLPRRLGYRLGP